MKKFILVFILLIISIILYARFIGTNNYKIVEHTIEIENLSESFNGFKIVQFSDFLLGSTKTIDDLETIINEINNINADIIVFTGDLISKNYDVNNDEIELLKEPIFDTSRPQSKVEPCFFNIFICVVSRSVL